MKIKPKAITTQLSCNIIDTVKVQVLSHSLVVAKQRNTYTSLSKYTLHLPLPPRLTIKTNHISLAFNSQSENFQQCILKIAIMFYIHHCCKWKSNKIDLKRNRISKMFLPGQRLLSCLTSARAILGYIKKLLCTCYMGIICSLDKLLA